MAQIQFLSGSRDGEIQDLDDGATLIVGSGADSHVRIQDQGIEAKHCQIYPAGGEFWLQDLGSQAGTFANMKRVPAHQLADRDILMVARTLLKFWRGTAPASGGAAAPAAAVDDGQATALKVELDQAKASLAAAEDKAKKAETERDGLKRDKAGLERVKEDLEKTKRDLEQAKRDGDAARKEGGDAKRELDKAKRETEDQKNQARQKQEALEQELDATKKEKTEVEAARDAQTKRGDDLDQELAKAKADVEARGGELEADRKALEALKAAEAASVRDRRPQLRKGSDVASAVAALGLPDALRDRLARAVRDEVDREVLGRAGPVVPVRGLRCPACDVDLEAELGRIAAGRRWQEQGRTLGLDGLARERLDALVEKARR